MAKQRTIPMGDNLHLAKSDKVWYVLYVDPIGEDLVRYTQLERFEGDDAEKQARAWVKSYHENRREISMSEGW